MNEPTIRSSPTDRARDVASPSLVSRWRDRLPSALPQPVLRFVEALSARRQRARDDAALRELGAHQLRDIGLVRGHEMTVGERALGRL